MRVLFILILIIGLFQTSFAQQSKMLSREQISDLYSKLYKSSDIDSISWNGNVKKCHSGSLSSDIYKKVADRVNFFRIACGLREISINPAFNKEAQDAAFLIKVNNVLTHNPATNLKCYSQSAANGCKKSCLSQTNFSYFPETSFITGFMQDLGDENYFVGHRKWILYTKLIGVGYGATDNTEALLTVDGVNYSDTLTAPEYIAYPWNGYVPVDLIFPKWSFSIPQNKVVDFSKATIKMFDSKGAEIKLVKLKEYKNYLDHSLVWTVKGMFSEEDIKYGKNNLEANGYLNKRIKVLIKNVKVDGKFKNYEYFVEPIKI